MTVRLQSAEQVEQAADDMEDRAERIANVTYTAPTDSGEVQSTLDESTARAQGPAAGAAVAAMAAGMPRVGRNEPCPCGSGKKFKHCHGQLT
jgi:preprotein translocase subunit SecA